MAKKKTDDLFYEGMGDEPKELKNDQKQPGRPARKDSFTKRTMNFSDELWEKLRIVAFINRMRGNSADSVTAILHEAGREYLKNHSISPEEIKNLDSLFNSK